MADGFVRTAKPNERSFDGFLRNASTTKHLSSLAVRSSKPNKRWFASVLRSATPNERWFGSAICSVEPNERSFDSLGRSGEARQRRLGNLVRSQSANVRILQRLDGKGAVKRCLSTSAAVVVPSTSDLAVSRPRDAMCSLLQRISFGLFICQEIDDGVLHTNPTRKRGGIVARPSLARRACVGK